MKNLKTFAQLNESYHDMKYDNYDMTDFKKFMFNDREMRSIYNKVRSSTDGVEMDMLMKTYQLSKDQYPEKIEAFKKWADGLQKKADFDDNTHLIIVSEGHEAYRVNNMGEITKYSNKEFSGGWKMTGIAGVYGSIVYKFPENFDRTFIEDLSKHLLYKNGRPKYTVADLDHGTNRRWGKGIISLRFEKIENK